MNTYRADLTPNPSGDWKPYLIECEGYSLKSHYPANRMCKVLFDEGYRGKMEVYGPSADKVRTILRITCDIEKMAEKSLSEKSSARGFVWERWGEIEMRSINRARGLHGIAPELAKGT